MILISTGHNPNRKGATFGDTSEYDEASLWTARILSILAVDLPNCKVRYVPTGSLTHKIAFINTQDEPVECAFELHFNSEPSFKAKGSEVLYYKGSAKGKRLADCIMDEFKQKKIFAPYRGSKEGVHHSGKPLLFLQKTKCTSVIIEPEFLFNINNINENFEDGCRAIANGIKKFVEKSCPKKAVEFTESKEEEPEEKMGIIHSLFHRWC